jgi:hypothetical protein
MKKRKCETCGTDISERPIHHYLCYQCWSIGQKTFNLGSGWEKSEKHSNRQRYNETYEKRYKGSFDYDMGPNWDYDEYPPENL